MKNLRDFAFPCVKLLTLACAFTLSACSLISEHYAEHCNSHAYHRTVLSDYLSSRYSTNSHARLAVIPFSVPANLAAYSNERPGLGNELAWKIHAALLTGGQIPIVEVFNRQDWPGKKEEFFTGNFTAISLAREAGYDLMLVGLVEPAKSLDSMSAYSKIIEVESGTTVWYGKTDVTTYRPELRSVGDAIFFRPRTPSVDFAVLIDSLAECIVDSALSEEPVY